jgi:hypothetical protein
MRITLRPDCKDMQLLCCAVGVMSCRLRWTNVQVWTALNADYIEKQAAKQAASDAAQEVGWLSSRLLHAAAGLHASNAFELL